MNKKLSEVTQSSSIGQHKNTSCKPCCNKDVVNNVTKMKKKSFKDLINKE